LSQIRFARFGSTPIQMAAVWPSPELWTAVVVGCGPGHRWSRMATVAACSDRRYPSWAKPAHLPWTRCRCKSELHFFLYPHRCCCCCCSCRWPSAQIAPNCSARRQKIWADALTRQSRTWPRSGRIQSQTPWPWRWDNVAVPVPSWRKRRRGWAWYSDSPEVLNQCEVTPHTGHHWYPADPRVLGWVEWGQQDPMRKWPPIVVVSTSFLSIRRCDSRRCDPPSRFARREPQCCRAESAASWPHWQLSMAAAWTHGDSWCPRPGDSSPGLWHWNCPGISRHPWWRHSSRRHFYPPSHEWRPYKIGEQIIRWLLYNVKPLKVFNGSKWFTTDFVKKIRNLTKLFCSRDCLVNWIFATLLIAYIIILIYNNSVRLYEFTMKNKTLTTITI